MIVRTLVLLLYSLTGYFTAANGFYLNFAAPKNKALESIQNTEDSPRNIDKLFHKKRHHHKKLIILDRKNKRVDDFVRKLLNVIEMNEGDKLLNEGGTLNDDKRKVNCHMSFGSIYNAKAKGKRCKKQHPVYKRKQPWINFVIPIKKNSYSDSTRQGFADDYLIDFNRRADIDFDYYNTAHRAHLDSNPKHDKETFDVKTKKRIEVANKAGELDAASKSLRRHHTRFQIVPNKHSVDSNEKHAKKSPTYSDTSDSDGTDNTEDDEDKYKKKSDSDSDDNQGNNKRNRPMKKIKDEWNDIIKMPDSVQDSSEESSAPKKDKRIKNTSETSSENEGSDSDASPKEDYGGKQSAPKKHKRIKNTYVDSENEDSDSDASPEEYFSDKQYQKEAGKEKYVYMQGHRLYNTNLDKKSRRMRIKDYFLPKRQYWTQDTINHLGPYWNSHETLGVS